LITPDVNNASQNKGNIISTGEINSMALSRYQ
jgi:hypothetical protein